MADRRAGWPARGTASRRTARASQSGSRAGKRGSSCSIDFEIVRTRLSTLGGTIPLIVKARQKIDLKVPAWGRVRERINICTHHTVSL